MPSFERPAKPCHADGVKVTPRRFERTAKRCLLLHVVMNIVKSAIYGTDAKCLPELVEGSYLAVNMGSLLVEIITDENAARNVLRTHCLFPVAAAAARNLKPDIKRCLIPGIPGRSMSTPMPAL
jgi:hypothetical protein